MRIPVPSDDVTLNRNHKNAGSQNKVDRESTQSPGGITEENFPHYKRVSDYLLGTCVGEGSFAKVRLALHCPTKEKVAVKIINKAKARRDSYVFKNLHREGRILQMVRHPNVVQVLDILETGNNYYLVTELCSGGELIDVVTEQGHLPEETVRRYTYQLVNAVEYLHERKIIHRDLKVENLLLDSGGNIKIIDFGLSNTISPVCSDISCALSTQCGSPAYAAPELLSKKSYGPKVDVWSIGVITFALLVGKLPFTVEPFHIPKLCRKMMRGEMNPIPTNISTHCRYFIRKLLCPDVTQRPNISEVSKLKWILTFQPESTRKSMTKTVVSSLLIDKLAGDVRRRHSLMSPLVTSPIEAAVVKEMSVSFGFACSDVIQCVQKNRPGPALATYHLLARRREEKNEKKKETNRFSQAIRTHIEVKLNEENNRMTNNGDDDEINGHPSSGSTTPSLQSTPTPQDNNLHCDAENERSQKSVSSPTYEIIRDASAKQSEKEEKKVEVQRPLAVDIRPKRSESGPWRKSNPVVLPGNTGESNGRAEFISLLENMKKMRENLQKRSQETILDVVRKESKAPAVTVGVTKVQSPRKSPKLVRKLPLREQHQHRTSVSQDSHRVRNKLPTPPHSPSNRPVSHNSASSRRVNNFLPHQRKTSYTPTTESPRLTPEWVKGHTNGVGTVIDTPPATPNRYLTVPSSLPPIVQKTQESSKTSEVKHKTRRSLPVGGLAKKLTSNRFSISNSNSSPSSPIQHERNAHKDTHKPAPNTAENKQVFVNKSRYGYYLSKRAEKSATASQPRPKKTISEPIATAISYLTSKHRSPNTGVPHHHSR
nr:hormonally up-regulated neu tumor-associated kinase homolog A [Ciona intestinalis]|eukprot:XP_026692612.1 hormonally up-regulated neu tumor-associated kinase homolog A [Ciona intestinalis]